MEKGWSREILRMWVGRERGHYGDPWPRWRGHGGLALQRFDALARYEYISLTLMPMARESKKTKTGKPKQKKKKPPKKRERALRIEHRAKERGPVSPVSLRSASEPIRNGV